jgi:hypothetical protein
MSDPRGWPLDPGERLVWQGSPGPGLHLSPPAVALGLAGALSLVMGTLFLGMSGEEPVMLVLGGVEILAGAGLIGAMLAWGPWMRRNRRYALTDRRVMVATRLPMSGDRLVMLPLVAIGGMEYLDGSPASLRLVPRAGQSLGPILLAGIPDAVAVQALVRRLQGEAA